MKFFFFRKKSKPPTPKPEQIQPSEQKLADVELLPATIQPNSHKENLEHLFERHLVLSDDAISADPLRKSSLRRTSSFSFQPVSSLKRGKSVEFCNHVIVAQTYSSDVYCRKAVQPVRLTNPEEIQEIKRELNELKSKMMVAEEAKQFTQYYF